jgi:hypothetical protein
MRHKTNGGYLQWSIDHSNNKLKAENAKVDLDHLMHDLATLLVVFLMGILLFSLR